MSILVEEKDNIQKEIDKKIAWLKMLSQNDEIQFLDRSVLANLVEKIKVYEDKKIVVVFNCRDKYSEILRLLEKNK